MIIFKISVIEQITNNLISDFYLTELRTVDVIEKSFEKYCYDQNKKIYFIKEEIMIQSHDETVQALSMLVNKVKDTGRIQ